MEARLKRRLFDRADLKGKKDPQITQITQISVCDCFKPKAKRTAVWRRFVDPFGAACS
jgi:hypothetical protein